MGAIAALLALGAITLIALGAIGLASVATPNMQGFNPGASVTVTDRGMSVYARSDDDRSQTVCTADDGSATTLARPTSEFAVDVSGSDFYEVARTPEGLNAGSYALTCEGTSQALYVGPAAPNTSASGLMGPASLVGGIMLGLFALALMIIAIVVGRSKGGPKADQAAYPYQSYPAAGYPPPPGGAPQGQNPYGAPAPQSYGQSQSDAYGQTAALPQGPEHQFDAPPPPPPPPWGSSSGEPTQAIAYGQGHFDPPAVHDAPDETQEQQSPQDGADDPAEHDDELPQEHDAASPDAPPSDSTDPQDGDRGPVQGHSEPNERNEQPFSYPPPPPPQ